MIQETLAKAGQNNGPGGLEGQRAPLGRPLVPGSADNSRGSQPGGADKEPGELTPAAIGLLLDLLEGEVKGGSSLIALEKVLASGALSCHQRLRVTALFKQVGSACQAKAADMAAALIDEAGSDVETQKATMARLALSTKSTHGEIIALVRLGQARQVSGALKDSMDFGQTSFECAKAMTFEARNLDKNQMAIAFQHVLADPRAVNSATTRLATRKLVEDLFPETAETRHAAAKQERRVVLEETSDGMAWLKGIIPASQATVIQHGLRHQAKLTPSQGRSLSNIEADLFAEYLLGGLAGAGQNQPGEPVAPNGPVNHQPWPPTRAPRVLVMADQAAVDVDSANPGNATPDSSNASLTQQDSAAIRLLVKLDPARTGQAGKLDRARTGQAGKLDRARTGQAGAVAPASGTPPDATLFHSAPDPPLGIGAAVGSPVTGAENQTKLIQPTAASINRVSGLIVGSRAIVTGKDLTHLVQTAQRQSIVVDQKTGRLVTLGLRSAKPGVQLAIPKVTWLWDDPTTWPAESAVSGSYQPSDWLTLMVMIRDQTCRWPGCTKPATLCQVDHHQPFSFHQPTLGQTRASNLGCLCLMHHQIKHRDNWTTRRNSDTGVTTWTHQTGQTQHAPPSILNATLAV